MIMLRGSHGEVLGLQTIATCRDGLKNPVTSRRQARLRRSNGIWERARQHDKRFRTSLHALARSDVIIYVFRLRSPQYGGNIIKLALTISNLKRVRGTVNFQKIYLSDL